MTPELFTHTFEVELKGDGSQFLKGEIEFNVDGKVSFHIQETSVPLSKDALHEFTELADHLQRMFYQFEGIKRIEIVQKPAP